MAKTTGTFLYTTDWHLHTKQPINRSGDIVEESFTKINYLLALAKKLSCPLVLGGDLFHTPRVSPELLNRLIDSIKASKVKVYTIIGNHDIDGANVDYEGTSIFTLIKSGVIHRIQGITDINGIQVSGIDYAKEVPAACFMVGAEVLVTHLPIVEREAIFDHYKVSDIKTDAQLVLCGHIHQPMDTVSNDTRYINPGCFIRRSSNEGGQKVLAYKITKDLSGFDITSTEIPHQLCIFKQAVDTDSKFESYREAVALHMEDLDVRKNVLELQIEEACKEEILRRLDNLDKEVAQ